MSALVEPARWQPFGTGRMAPAGSLANAALLGRVQAYKREVAGSYRSLPPDQISTFLPPGPCLASEKLDGETWFTVTQQDPRDRPAIASSGLRFLQSTCPDDAEPGSGVRLPGYMNPNTASGI
jgi:hypothetical protein